MQSLLVELSRSLDRLAEELDRERPVLARALRTEAGRADGGCAAERHSPWRRPRALRPLLYRALEEGALDARQFDRLMTVAARARR